ncbi:MAG: EamA family transporter [Lachnospiraceae bacterium]|jgi:drug/metabolite transporter (DMT)-like permease
MSWFIYSLICLLGWGCADLFYKMGTDKNDRYSHLKIAVWVGLVMGVSAFLLMPFAETGFSIGSLIANAVKYLPVSFFYIASMVIGYAGLRYLELSIISPIQNTSGALSTILMLIFFLTVGRINSFSEAFSLLDIAGTLLVVIGVVSLAVVEQHLKKKEQRAIAADDSVAAENRKYRFGALALLFPLLYCVFDTIGTAADGIILDEETGLNLGEIDVIILYGLTFLFAGIIAWIFLWMKRKKPYNPFAKKELAKGVAACCEELGQVFYVYAMASRPMLTAPMVASYCIVSVILSRIFLKEKLTKGQYACVIVVIAGILLLGVSEGMA